MPQQRRAPLFQHTIFQDSTLMAFPQPYELAPIASTGPSMLLGQFILANLDASLLERQLVYTGIPTGFGFIRRNGMPINRLETPSARPLLELLVFPSEERFACERRSLLRRFRYPTVLQF